MDIKALFNITYGLYLLTANENGEDNGCITNSVIQVANNPERIAITVLKQNKTHNIISVSKKFCVSTLTESAPFSLFKHFGMQSGANVDKFADFKEAKRTPNGLLRLDKHTNAYFTAFVTDEIDLGTHTMFIASVTDAQILSEEKPCTYSYYQSNIKPKPEASQKKRWVCSVCGYVYEGEEVPDDFICPWCKHSKEAFEQVN